MKFFQKKLAVKNKLLVIVVEMLFASQIFAQNQSPVVSNVYFTQREDGSLKVDVHYDVNDADGNTMTVTMKASSDNGATWNYSCNNVTGDLGVGITSGTNKHIVWDFAIEHPQTFGDQFRIKIIADDGIYGVPCPGTPTVEYSGKTYNTALIGNQCWLKENLDIGTMILGNQNATNNETIEKYCYNDSISNCNTYGGLYQWNEAMQYVTTQGEQGICPSGWHIPTYAELQTLGNSVNGDGNALKAIGQGNGAGAGTNTSGFSALLAGNRHQNNSFYGQNLYSLLWSSSEINSTQVNIMNLHADYGNVLYNPDGNYKTYGFSIRCLKDSVVTSKSCPGTPTVSYAGKTYNSVQLGSQCWLRENLDVGTMIDSMQNQANNGIIEKFCYNNNINNCNTYGGLYQWNEAMQYVTTQGARGICPSGWHIPTSDELQLLLIFVNYQGNALKAIDQGTGNGVGTNTSGFSALLSGFSTYFGQFADLGMSSYFWSSTEMLTTYAWYLRLFSNNNSYQKFHFGKESGVSVRCLKN